MSSSLTLLSSPLALSSPPLSLHLLFATCMGNRFPHLSAWLFNLFYGILLRFLGHVVMFFHPFCLAGSALSDWHALMSPKVKLKRLKVWHLNTVPAGSVFTYTWPTHTHTQVGKHRWNDFDVQSVIMCEHLCMFLFLWPQKCDNPDTTSHLFDVGGWGALCRRLFIDKSIIWRDPLSTWPLNLFNNNILQISVLLCLQLQGKDESPNTSFSAWTWNF